MPKSCITVNLVLYFSLEPPLLRGKSDEEIQRFRVEPLSLPIVANTQFVERLVQTVASLGDVSTDPQIRDGYVKATLARQRLLPKRETKADFLRLMD